MAFSVGWRACSCNMQGRAGKKKLVRRHHKVFEKQESSFRRYADVLEKLGLPVQLKFTSIYGEGKVTFRK